MSVKCSSIGGGLKFDTPKTRVLSLFLNGGKRIREKEVGNREKVGRSKIKLVETYSSCIELKRSILSFFL